MKVVSTQEFVQVRVLQQPFSFSPRAPVSKQKRGPRLPTDRSFPARDSRPADPGTVIVGAAKRPGDAARGGENRCFFANRIRSTSELRSPIRLFTLMVHFNETSGFGVPLLGEC